MKLRWMLMLLVLAGLAMPALAVDKETAEKVADRREQMDRERDEDRQDRGGRYEREDAEDREDRDADGQSPRRRGFEEEDEYGDRPRRSEGRPGPGRPGAREDRPWMGVVVAPVPAPLRAHLKLDGKGVMVLNIVKGSPADQAGLAQYDVLVGFDGRTVGDEPDDLLEQIAAAKIGQAVKLSVIRGGKLDHKTLTLAKPVPREQARMKYQADPQQEWAGQRRWRRVPREGGIGWVLPGGRRIAPEDIEVELNGKKLGDLGRVRVEVRRGPDGVRVRRVGDGQNLSIHRKDDAFTVSRQDEAGKVVEKTYDSAEALRKGDPDAWELWQRYSQQAARPGSGGRVSLEDLLEGEDGERLHRQLREMMERMERGPGRFGEEEEFGRPGQGGIPPMPESMDEQFRRLQEQVEQLRRHALEQMEARRRAQREGSRGPGRPEGPRRAEDEQEARGEEGSDPRQRGEAYRGDRKDAKVPARQEFHVEPDGKITVSVSRGPQSFTRTFKDEQAFKQAAPKLYEQYRKLMGELE